MVGRRGMISWGERRGGGGEMLERGSWGEKGEKRVGLKKKGEGIGGVKGGGEGEIKRRSAK